MTALQHGSSLLRVVRIFSYFDSLIKIYYQYSMNAALKSAFALKPSL